jgi:Zn-dependent protease with chaperone function
MQEMRKIFFVRSILALVLCVGFAGCAALPRGITGTTSAMPAKGKFIATIDAADTFQPDQTVSETKLLRGPLTAPTGIVEDPQFVDLCNGIINRLLASWPYQRPNVQVLIVPSSDFTSDTTPNGAIIISTGLLHYLVSHPAPDNGDRLAFVLAHELSHVLMGQTNNRATVAKDAARLRGLVYLGASLTLGAKSAVVADATQSAVLGDYLFGVAAEHGAFPAWQRDQEGEADLLAIDLMAKAGYNLQGATDVLTILIAQQQKAARAEPAMLSFEHYIKTKSVGNGTEVSFGIAQWLTPYVDHARMAIEAGHPEAMARLKTAEAYIAREYPTYLPPMGGVGFNRVVNAAPTKLMIADEPLLGDAELSLAHHQPMQAEEQLDRIRSIVLKRSEYFLYLQAETYIALGRLNDGLQDIIYAQHQPLETQRMMVLAAQIFLANHLDTAALHAFAHADQKFHTQAYLPNRIAIEKSEGNNNLAALMVERCNLTGKMRLISECDNANR